MKNRKNKKLTQDNFYIVGKEKSVKRRKVMYKKKKEMQHNATLLEAEK